MLKVTVEYIFSVWVMMTRVCFHVQYLSASFTWHGLKTKVAVVKREMFSFCKKAQLLILCIEIVGVEF